MNKYLHRPTDNTNFYEDRRTIQTLMQTDRQYKLLCKQRDNINFHADRWANNNKDIWTYIYADTRTKNNADRWTYINTDRQTDNTIIYTDIQPTQSIIQ